MLDLEPLCFFGQITRKAKKRGLKSFLKKMKEVVDSRMISYIVFNPDGDFVHSNGNVLRQSASSI
jgi:hypothetical protein